MWIRVVFIKLENIGRGPVLKKKILHLILKELSLSYF